MFEAGAQNKEALRTALIWDELRHLRSAVLGTIQAIDHRGAHERVQSLIHMHGLVCDPLSVADPLTDAPALVLYAEKESAVRSEPSPAGAALAISASAWFPRRECRLITNRRGSPVQHASLIFHGFAFQPHVTQFYAVKIG